MQINKRTAGGGEGSRHSDLGCDRGISLGKPECRSTIEAVPAKPDAKQNASHKIIRCTANMVAQSPTVQTQYLFKREAQEGCGRDGQLHCNDSAVRL